MKMTKAERIFKATRFDCKMHIKDFGITINPDGSIAGYNMVSGDEVVSTRTLNAMDKILASKRNTLMMDLKLDIIDEAKYSEEADILGMVETTIRNSRKSIAI